METNCVVHQKKSR